MEEDGALVSRCLRRERDALERFVERFRGPVFGLCWRMLEQREDAEDVTQETFVRAFRHLSSWEPDRPLRPWVMAIAANRCRTRLSRRQSQPQTLGEWHELVPSRPVETGDLSEELQSGLKGLRDDYRMCFIMFYQQDMAIQEIAQTLDCPEGTIKTWLHRARKQLAEWLLQRGVVDRNGYELRRP